VKVQNWGRVAFRVVEEAKLNSLTPTSFQPQLTKQAHEEKEMPKKKQIKRYQNK
jgi:hypothetical protein